VFEADTIDAAETAAREFVKKLDAYSEYRGHVTEIHLVTAYDGFCGKGIVVESV
jgi:hypothetical protein